MQSSRTSSHSLRAIARALPPHSGSGRRSAPPAAVPQRAGPACREAQTLPAFLDAYRQYPGLSVHWVLVGPSGRHTRPATGGVLRHYPQCAGTGHAIVKTIANTYFLTNVASHPHNVEFRCAPRIRPCRVAAASVPGSAHAPDTAARSHPTQQRRGQLRRTCLRVISSRPHAWTRRSVPAAPAPTESDLLRHSSGGHHWAGHCRIRVRMARWSERPGCVVCGG